MSSGPMRPADFHAIDTHVHCWRWEELRLRWRPPSPLDRDHLPKTLAPLAGRSGVRAAVLVESGPSIQELLRLATSAGADRFITAVVAPLDLTASSVRRDIAALSALPLVRGARMNLESHGDSKVLLRRPVIHALRAVADADLLWEFLVAGEQLPDVLAALDAVPNLRAVLDHMGKPQLVDPNAIVAWKADIHRLAANTSVTCKLSFGFRADALDRIAREQSGWPVEALRDPVAHLIDEFGSGRLMWGSDWPLSALLGDYEDSVVAYAGLIGHLPSADRDRIFSTNAQALYRTGTLL